MSRHPIMTSGLTIQGTMQIYIYIELGDNCTHTVIYLGLELELGLQGI